jgi:hypothetical protein
MTLQHLRLLSTLQIIQGVLEGVMGLLFAVSPGGTGAGAALWVGLCLAGFIVACNGLLRVVAGALNGSCRGRGLGISTLAVGLLSALTCFCLPTSLALFVYGLLVYSNKDVRQAFARRAAGASVDEIARTWGTGLS